MAITVRLGRAIVNYFADTTQFIGATRRASEALQRQERAARTLQNQYRRLSNSASSFIRNQINLGSVLFTIGGAAGLTQVVRSIATFEQALSTAGAISGATVEGVCPTQGRIPKTGPNDPLFSVASR